MVRCNQHKWLYGVIQRMSDYGVRIWIADAQLLVNVPIVLLKTHVSKMSTFLELRSMPQSKRMWTVATVDKDGCRRVLLQCVRPAHLSHRQLYRMLHCLVCAICKRPLALNDMVSPWPCPDRVHAYCLQLREQHCSQINCPSCRGNSTRPLVPFQSSFQSTNFSEDQWAEIQCACGYWGSMPRVGNVNAPMLCPVCQRPVNVNLTTLGVQTGYANLRLADLGSTVVGNGQGQSFKSMETPCVYSNVENVMLPKTYLHEREYGCSVQPFTGPARLEVIEEGRESPSKEEFRTFSVPPLHVSATDEDHGQASSSSTGQVSFGNDVQNLNNGPTVLIQASTRALIANADVHGAHRSMGFVIRPAAMNINRGPLAGVEQAEESSGDVSNSSAAIEDKIVMADEIDQRVWNRNSLLTLSREYEMDAATNESSDTFATDTTTAQPVYVNHFDAFVKLATAGTSTDNFPSTSSTPEPQDELDEGLDAPAWVTVIKDGKDARKNNKQKELDKAALQKEAKYFSLR